MKVSNMNKFEVSNLNLFYGDNHALKDISLKIPSRQVMSLI